MKKCRYVIQDGSTVAFEALYTGRIVFSFSSRNNILIEDSHPLLHSFQNARDFWHLWNTRNEFKAESHNEYFCLKYKENYIQFLKKCGVDIDKN